VTSNPASLTVPAGKTAQFAAAATGSSSVKWQFSTDGATWTDIPAATAAAYAFTATAADFNKQFRAVFTNSAGSVATAAATLTVRSIGRDFNADGQSDIVWRNTANGLLSVWYLNGVTFA